MAVRLSRAIQPERWLARVEHVGTRKASKVAGGAGAGDEEDQQLVMTHERISTNHAPHEQIRLFGIALPRRFAASVAATGSVTIIAFCAQNVLQELVTTRLLRADSAGAVDALGVVLTASESLWCTAVPALELALHAAGRGVLLQLFAAKQALRYALMAVVLSVSTGLGNMSVSYISVAMLVVIKSCKLLPVMAVGISCFGKTHLLRQWAAASLLVGGVVLCVLADAHGAVRFSWLGVGLAATSLVGDAIYPHLQEAAMMAPPPPSHTRATATASDACAKGMGSAMALTATDGGNENASDNASAHRQQQVLIGTNTFVLVYSALALLALTPPSKHVGGGGHRPHHPLYVLFWGRQVPLWVKLAVVFHGALQYIGLVTYLALLRIHSPRTAVGVATLRKGATVFLSLVVAGRVPSPMYACGVALVLSAAVVERNVLCAR